MKTIDVNFEGEIFAVEYGHFTDSNDKEYVGVVEVNRKPWKCYSEQFLEDIQEALEFQIKENKLMRQKHFSHD